MPQLLADQARCHVPIADLEAQILALPTIAWSIAHRASGRPRPTRLEPRPNQPAQVARL